jgi:general secretion pathway protein H
MTSRGFTLVELLVVLAVMALVLMVAGPMVSNALPGAQLKTAARDLAAGLRYTRNRAISTNRSTAFLLDTEARRYRVEGEPEVRTLPAEFAVSILTARSELEDARTGRIRFFPDGSSTGGEITLSNGARTYRVTVDWLMGRIRTRE